MADNEQTPQPEEKAAPLDVGGLSEFFREKSAEHDHRAKATDEPEPETETPPVENPAEPPAKEEPPAPTQPEQKPDPTEARVAALEERMRAAQAPPQPIAAPPPKQIGEDPRMQEVRDIFYTDTPRALQLMLDIARDQSKAEREAERAAEAAQQSTAVASAAAVAAIDKIAEKYQVSKKLAKAMLRDSMHQFDDHFKEELEAGRVPNFAIMTNPDNYLIACEREGYELPTAQAVAEVPPPPVAPDPPGSKRTAPPAPRGAARAPLSPEDDRSLSRLARSVDLGEDGVLRFKQKVAANR